MNIAFATSLFAENNFDEFMTLNFAEEKEISAIQFYMNDCLQSDKDKIEKIRSHCQKKLIKILCHSPKMLGEASDDIAHCEALSSLFYENSPKLCVFHFDEKNSIENMISDCQKLIAFGIIPCVENFYIDKTSQGLIENTKKFVKFFDEIYALNLPVLPVLDFPRLFIEQFINSNPISACEQLIKSFIRRKIIIHAIDAVSPQQKRSDWCAIGQGIVEWNKIFNILNTQKVSVEFIVLEYENKNFVDESIKYLKNK